MTRKRQKWKGNLCTNIGWNYFDRQEYYEALFMLQKALEFFEQLGDPLKVMTAKWYVARTSPIHRAY